MYWGSNNNYGGEDGLNDIPLTITDDGVGFDVNAVGGKGLGLISMIERLEAIGGTFDIRSRPEEGTHLKATVPTPLAHDSQTAAG